jgi:hypothetical protein
MSDIADAAVQPPALTTIMAAARGHGEMTDTRQWIDNLERVLEIAWEIMSPHQRTAFCEHADVMALIDAAGQR